MTEQAIQGATDVLGQFWRLTKPRVVSLIVFTAVIGMLLASPTLPPLGLLALATVGIALVAGAAAAFNCLVEQKIDSAMARTRGRPTVMGSITTAQMLVLAGHRRRRSGSPSSGTRSTRSRCGSRSPPSSATRSSTR